MFLPLPALDAHAHIRVARRAANAVILAVTNSVAEFDNLGSSRMTVYGVGCHPADASAQDAFREAEFAKRLAKAALVGEVGLDGRSRVTRDVQAKVLRAILNVAGSQPCFISLHSVRAQEQVLDLLHESTITGPILHWWTGSAGQTRDAAALGCWFSVGPGLLRRPEQLARLPRDRVLTETDAPVGNAVAGRIDGVEGALAAMWGCDIEDVRLQVWRNFATLVSATRTRERLSAEVVSILDSIREGG